ncbi:MAG: hypothetical protein JW891_15215 [Candidatus Lokiarchaeota archaeon]|nr:hypothetical protein [Candidatus Lokiarchaeota archaeon]
MKNKELYELIIKKYGGDVFEEGLKFPNNKISIIFLQPKPIKINCMVLDNDREFHIVINQEEKEIFHDCPRFLIHKDDNKKICAHIIKLILSINESLSFKLLNDIDNYVLSAEDFGSRHKSENYMILAKSCFTSDNSVEGLNYLNKALVNRDDCSNIVGTYLKTAIENNLFVEFFEFLTNDKMNGMNASFFIDQEKLIEEGFKSFLASIPRYSFYNVLKIIESIDQILNSIDFSFLSRFLIALISKTKSTNLKEKYFAFYFLLKHKEISQEEIQSFDDLISNNLIQELKNQILVHFQNQIENFGLIEELNLLKKHFKTFKISKETYNDTYKKYKKELQEIERKLYIKKFAFLKLFRKKFKVNKSTGGFKKKRNFYIVDHDKENINNPAYHYILARMGFYGYKNQFIKSSEMGPNIFMLKDLFLDDIGKFPDVLYYKNQFWGDIKSIEIDSNIGYSLLPKPLDYDQDGVYLMFDRNETIIVEWDLVNKPVNGSLIVAYSSQILVPDQKNPLFHDLKPFDLCYCKKIPEEIESEIIKKTNVISKCSFKDAINSIAAGMDFIEGYYPLSLIKDVIDKKIEPFEAHALLRQNPNKLFIPNYNKFVQIAETFLFDFIRKEKNYVFETLKKTPEKKTSHLLFLLGLDKEFEGMNLPYGRIAEELFEQNLPFKEFKSNLINKVHDLVKQDLEEAKVGCTEAYDLNKMQYTSFSYYLKKILQVRKNEFERAKIKHQDEFFDLSEVLKTYYGIKFAKMLKLGQNKLVRPNKFQKIKEYAKKLGLKLNLID